MSEVNEYYSKEFIALLDEALFTKDILGIGVTQLYKANYAQRGIYYQTFICLSTGIERIGKLCLILDSYIENNGKFPNENYIRKHGHRIEGLYESCCEIAKNRGLHFRFSSELQDPIHQTMISILQAFAESSGRYHNINIIANKNMNNDCIKRWKEEVDIELFRKKVSKRKKEKIEKNAKMVGALLDDNAVVNHISETGEGLYEAIDASRETGMWEAVAPYRQLYMLQIIRFFVEILVELSYEAMQVTGGEKEEIPYFSEVFGLFYNSDAYFRSRKTWEI